MHHRSILLTAIGACSYLILINVVYPSSIMVPSCVCYSNNPVHVSESGISSLDSCCRMPQISHSLFLSSLSLSSLSVLPLALPPLSSLSPAYSPPLSLTSSPLPPPPPTLSSPPPFASPSSSPSKSPLATNRSPLSLSSLHLLLPLCATPSYKMVRHAARSSVLLLSACGLLAFFACVYCPVRFLCVSRVQSVCICC